MRVRKIYTDNPDREQWKMLLHFSYPESIQKFFDSQGVGNKNDSNLIENICASVLQAKEYFDTSKIASLQIAPVLLYYGVTNLLSAFASLKTGRELGITGHGMKIADNNFDLTNLGDIKVIPSNASAGSLSILNRSYGSSIDICDKGAWRLAELFGAIPDLFNDFITYFPGEEPSVIPIEEVYTGQFYFDRFSTDLLSRFNDQDILPDRVVNYKKAYLPNQSQSDYVILYRRLNYEDISTYSLVGEKFLVISRNKQGTMVYLPLEIVILMILFCFGFLCRYKASLWNPFVRSDYSGKKLLIETFLDYSRRVVPNLALNYISDKRCIFVNQVVSTIDSSEEHSKREIEELVRSEVNKILTQKNRRGE
ncbi:YaaC family protein [Nostoc sp.]